MERGLITTLHETFIATVPVNGHAQHLLLRAIIRTRRPAFGVDAGSELSRTIAFGWREGALGVARPSLGQVDCGCGRMIA